MLADNADVFLLCNERESLADIVASELRNRGVSLYFYRTDLPFGSEIKQSEADRLQSARIIVVLLGDQGWGVSQAEIGQQALSLAKPMLPVLIGDPPEEAMGQVGNLFRLHRRLDLRKPSDAGYDELARSISAMFFDAGSAGTEFYNRSRPRFDEIINTLVDGSDQDRSLILQRLTRYPMTNGAELARRLREAINKDFSAGQESRFATAVRAPKRLASTRSWMLSVLIWLDPSNSESERIILEHVQVAHEPDREVRFWTLAGIVQRRLSYLDEALAFTRGDSAAEISGLATVVSAPSNDSTLQAFRTALDAQDFETAWHVLRILRIVAIPLLAPDVVRQLDRSVEGKPLTYDALFALASPEMASAARPSILERPGLDGFVELLIQEARSANPVARFAFGRILSVFNKDEVRAALQAMAVDGEAERLVQQILNDLDELGDEQDLGDPPIAGFSSDTIVISQDDIGIARDVETLASVMLARDVTPPLAIGLFGEWGSGKSFFMRSIEAAATRIASDASLREHSQFCADIVQINFNAWHYADANLWASLVSHILDGLSQHLMPSPSSTEQHVSLARELVSAKAEMAMAQAERERAASELELSAKSLEDTKAERERREIRLRDLRAGDLIALLEDDKELDKSIKDALSDVGAPAAFESVAELNKVVEESYSTLGRMTALLVSLLSGRNVFLAFMGILVFFLAPPLIEWVVRQLVSEYAAVPSRTFAKVTVVAGSISGILRAALSRTKTGLDALSRAKRKVDERLAMRREAPSDSEKRLQAEVLEAKVREKAAIDRLSAASTRAKDLENRVALLVESQSLGYFISERSRSDDYRRHLGLISTIRKDFDGLVARLKSVSGQGEPKGKQIDRIILYIDDVDRCPPKMVLDILQAVHLLLAYELFVVVVSVDPRWLLRSLEMSLATLHIDADSEAWSATPQDYLEKIFQIPFSVRPMGDRGFTRLMGRLLTPTAQSPAPVDVAAGQNSSPFDQSADGNRNAETTEAAVRPRPETPLEPSSPVPTEIEALAKSLSIGAAELEFARTMSQFLPTPRGAKRFANIYRLLKASRPGDHQADFEGNKTVPGEFQLPMLLLALLVGQSNAARLLFPHFLSNARSGQLDWWSIYEPHATGLTDGDSLLKRFGEIAAAPLFPNAPELVVTWLPQVARYSFTTARMFLSESEHSNARREGNETRRDAAQA